MLRFHIVMFGILLPLVENSIYLYDTEDGPSLEFFDCVYYKDLAYCRRPSDPVTVQRDKVSGQCYQNGTIHSFISLLSNNISVSTVLHQWKSSIDKVEQYSFYLEQQIRSEDDDKKYLCQCTHPRSFGKKCAYLLPIDNSTFEATLTWEVRMRFLNQDQAQVHSDIVCYTTLKCNSGLLCLDWRDICDGVQQCLFGYDEENCDRLEFHECEDDEYRCMNGMCIPDQYFLDGDYDCMDFTDEKHPYNDMNCTFQPVNLECDDRTCLPNQWTCGDGQCIDNRLSLQFSFTMGGCSSRRDQFYMCETGVVYKGWTLPNGKCDRSKDYEELRVPDGHAIQDCIYYFKCELSRGAEKKCPCRNWGSCIDFIRYLCPSLIIYPLGEILGPYAVNTYRDIYKDDLRLPDQIALFATIKCRRFLIKRSLNLPYPLQFDLRDFEVQLCDNSEHGSLYMDKGYNSFCHNESLTSNNRSYHFIDVCDRSKECISAYRISDGIANCVDGLDESHSGSIVAKACSHLRHYRFRCALDEPTCLFVYFLGNGIPDCKNKRDESWLGTDVPLSEMICNRELKRDCQLLRQYVLASWNSNENVTHSKQMSTGRITFRRFCDTFYDLRSKSDEDLNSCKNWWKCLDEQWQCNTGQCIYVTWVLDGEWDCTDASDEESIFIYDHAFLPRNLRVIDKASLVKKFNTLYKSQPFPDICNLSIEYPCFRVDVTDPLVNISTYRPCINLRQIGDGIIDCIGGRDERNSLEHCTNPTTLGRDFLCLSSKTCIDEDVICESKCSNPLDNHVLCYDRKNSSNCADTMHSMCINGTCAQNSKCNRKNDCHYGEDEYMCDPALHIIVDNSKSMYREKKNRIIKNLKHSFRLPHLSEDIDGMVSVNSTIISVRNTTKIIRSFIPANPPLPYVCNRGVGVS